MVTSPFVPPADASSLPHVWGLIDDRPGTAHQVEGILKKMDYPYSLRRFTYNGKARLPNVLLGETLSHTNPAMSDRLEPPLPSIIVSAGRRLAPVALAIKKQMGDHIYLAHLMAPEMDVRKFDLVCLPFHDKVPKKGKIIQTLGAPHPITAQSLKDAAAQWSLTIGALPEPRIAVLLGGDTKEGKFTVEEAEEVMSTARRLAGRGSVLVTTSHRTSPAVMKHLQEMLAGIPHHLFTYGSNSQNPYLAYLALAEKIIVTGDSVSMISEACYTSKPVYVYPTRHTLAEKHKRFLTSLMQEKYVRQLSDYSSIWTGGRVLDEAEKIAAQIRMGYTAKRKG